MELLIVIMIICLVAAISLPSIVNLMTSGADSHAYGILASQLAVARALAVLSGTYVGVHVQMADEAATGLKNKCYTAIVRLDSDKGAATGGSLNILDDSTKNWTPGQWIGCALKIIRGAETGNVAIITANTPTSISAAVGTPNATSGYRIFGFKMAEGYAPQPMPGNIAFGEISSGKFVSTSTYQNLGGDGLNDGNTDNLGDFTTFTIVFSPKGEVVTRVFDGLPHLPFKSMDPLFGGGGTDALWNYIRATNNYACESGITAITMFDYGKLKPQTAANRIIYLNEWGQFLPFNLYTGKLFPRK